MNNYDDYFCHLRKISLMGKLYKRFFSSPILYLSARRFGPRILEVGSGTGSGILGTFPSLVCGLDVNPIAVEYCKSVGFNAQHIHDNGSFPVMDNSFDSCILDNVLEHIVDPQITLDECYRVTGPKGGLIVAVPGVMGYNSDPDHYVFYDEDKLRRLDSRWVLSNLFTTPFILPSTKLSTFVRQYCLVAVYKKSIVG